MKHFLILFGLLSLVGIGNAQDKASATALVKEGVRLHDEEKYDLAIAKYREALVADADNIDALYEMSFTFFSANANDSCIFYCEKLINMKAPDAILKNVYVNFGSCYDNMKMPQKSIEVYDKGIKAFPDFYLLHFNKGVTYIGSKKYAEARACFEKSVSLKPFHSGSNYWLSRILADNNKVPAILTAAMVSIIESTNQKSQRGKSSGELIESLLKSNVTTNASGGANISLMLPSGDKKKENDFSAVDLVLSIMEVSPTLSDTTLKLDTEEKKLSFKLQMMCNALNDYKKQKGFYWKFYAPFFSSLKAEGHVDLLARLILLNKNFETNNTWLNEHEEEVKKFSKWVSEFSWVTIN